MSDPVTLGSVINCISSFSGMIGLLPTIDSVKEYYDEKTFNEKMKSIIDQAIEQIPKDFEDAKVLENYIKSKGLNFKKDKIFTKADRDDFKNAFFRKAKITDREKYREVETFLDAYLSKLEKHILKNMPSWAQLIYKETHENHEMLKKILAILSGENPGDVLIHSVIEKTEDEESEDEESGDEEKSDDDWSFRKKIIEVMNGTKSSISKAIKTIKNRKKIFISVLSGLILIVILIKIIPILFGMNSVTIGNKKFNRSETQVTIKDVTIGTEEIAKLNKMENLGRLVLESCDIIADLSELAKIEDIHSIELYDSTLPSYDFISKLGSIKTLVLSNVASTTELSESTLSVLPLTDLETLIVENSSISNISFLSEASELHTIKIKKSNVKCIDALAGLEKLMVVEFDGCPISSVRETFQSLSIELISFEGCGLEDLSGLDNLTILTSANLRKNQLKAIPSCVKKSTETIRKLYLGENSISGQDVQVFIPQCNLLEVLDICWINLQDLSFISNCRELTEIYAAACNLSSIEGLETGHSKLHTVVLSHNLLTNIDNLSMSVDVVGKSYLFLDHNNITEAAFLPGKCNDDSWHYIFLNGNTLDVNTLPSDLSVENLYIDYSNDLLTMDLEGMDLGHIYIVNAPFDRQLKLKEKFTFVDFISEDDIQAVKEEVLPDIRINDAGRFSTISTKVPDLKLIS